MKPWFISCFFAVSCSFVQAQQTDFLTANIDPSIHASSDFFRYANGGWIKKTPIPASESGWGIGNLVQEEIYQRLLQINQKATGEVHPVGSSHQKIGDFWFAAMDTNAINHRGLAEISNELDRINRVETTGDLTDLAASFQKAGIDCLFSGYVVQDDMNSSAMIFRLDQGGIGLPNREYYFRQDARTKQIRKAYLSYLASNFQLLKMSPALSVKLSKEVFDLEKRLAAASRKLEDLRDPYKNYNKYTFPMLADRCNSFYWLEYARKIGIEQSADSIVVGQPEFFDALGKELKNTDIAIWKHYLKIRLLQSYASYLDQATYQVAFNFRKFLTGAAQPRPRWKRVLDAEEHAMGELLGQLFAKAYFNETAKARYSNLVEAIRGAYANRIQHLSWMSDSTKSRALAKLATVTKKVGYPDQWKDFSTLEISRKSYLRNMVNANIFWHYYRIRKLGKPVDRNEWEMTPQTYNAYYNPSNNEIVLPSGIFAVPGMKDEDLDDAFVYGYAGASTIGHEITHGFDDQGRQYDAAGNLKDWWTIEDGIEFNARAKFIIQQFNEFIPVDTLHVNGEATQGENIADLGGLLIGLDAFKKTEQYRSGKRIAGLTPLQRYFLGYAYGWMYQDKKERLATQVLTDVHAPAKERVNGPVVNIAEFYEAFGVKKGDPMYRAEGKRVTIW